MDRMDNGKAIGEKVRQLRERRRWKPGQLAAYSGVSPGYISKLENGKMKRPSAAKLSPIAKVLGVPLNELLYPTVPVPDSVIIGLDISDPRIRLVLQHLAELPPEDREIILSIIEDFHRRHYK